MSRNRTTPSRLTRTRQLEQHQEEIDRAHRINARLAEHGRCICWICGTECELPDDGRRTCLRCRSQA